MEDEEIEPRVESSSKEQCITRFKELWTVDEMKSKIIPEMSPNILKIYSLNDMKISNHNKLAQILFDSVGNRFLRDIENNIEKRRTFLYSVLNASVEKNIINTTELVNLAKSINKTKSRSIANSSDKLRVISNLPANSYWLKELSILLGFPTSVSAKDDNTEDFIAHESVVPVLDLNPLYDYQHSTGRVLRKMLEGKNEDKRILISVPTGSGKTRMIVETLIEWLNAGKPSINKQQRNSKFILWVAQSQELCEQAVSAFKTTFQAKGKRGTVLHVHRYWGSDKSKELPVSLEKLEDEYSERSVVVSTIQSLMAIFRSTPETLERLAEVTSCIVIDEAHHSIADSYNAVLTKMGFNLNLRKQEMSTKGIILVGLTATPFRGSGDNIETQTLLRRYGNLHFPSIPIYDGEENFKPHALIDCQTYSMVGHEIRIIGERSYDRDGFIKDEDFKWKISKVKKFIDIYSKNENDNENTQWTFEKEKNIDFLFNDEGEYKITLEVTDNEGEKAESSVYIKVVDQKENEGIVSNTDKQKSLYRKLIRRKILCEVNHWILKSGEISLSSADLEYLDKFKEFRPETIREIGNDPDRNKLIIDTIYDLKTKHKRNKILFFGCSVEHSRDIAAALKILHNMDARYVDSKMSIDQRVEAIEQFRNGSVEVLCNYDVLTTGFDAPNINSVFVGRPIRSTLMYTQIIGRGLRGTKSGGTDDVLLVDIDDNFQLHGYSNNSEDLGNLTELGWKVYSEYWKPWDSDQPMLKQSQPPQKKLYRVMCTNCGNIGTGIEDISRVFGHVGDLDELISALDNDEIQKIPDLCKECEAKEIEKTFAESEPISLPETEQSEPISLPETEQSEPNADYIISKETFIKNQISAGVNSDVAAKLYDKTYGITSSLKICPKCNVSCSLDQIEEIFGYRKINGIQKPQSYCRKCRNTKLPIPDDDYCPFVEYLEKQNNIQGNYQMVLGLYALETQNGTLSSPNIEDACDLLLQHNPDKKSVINKDHSVFGVYFKHGLITHIDAITGDIVFKTILQPEKFKKICYEKLNKYTVHQTLKEEQEKNLDLQSSETIDAHFYKLKESAFGHVPTFSQYNKSTNLNIKKLMHRLYGGYDNYLKSKGESVRDDPNLQDTLYEEYFELYHLSNSVITKEMLNVYGEYVVEDYVECFGTYEKFDSIVKEIISKIKDISSSVTEDDLFQDYSRIEDELGRTPHFEEIRTSSYFGIEYYLQYFDTLGKFIKLSKLDPQDRSVKLFEIQKQQLEHSEDNLEKLLCPQCKSKLHSFEGGIACTNSVCGYYKTNL